MKEITFPAPKTRKTRKTTVEFTDLLEIKYPLIGIATESDGKVTLIPADYTSSLYIARCVKCWEKGNGYNPNRKNEQTIKEWCEFFRKSHKAKIYLFDSFAELFTWLMK